MKPLICTHCNTEMKFLSEEVLQLGQTGWILGDLPNLLAGSLPVKIYLCPRCRRLEFFASEAEAEDADDIPKKTCPKCGTVHDFDYPRCPSCKHDYFVK